MGNGQTPALFIRTIVFIAGIFLQTLIHLVATLAWLEETCALDRFAVFALSSVPSLALPSFTLQVVPGPENIREDVNGE